MKKFSLIITLFCLIVFTASCANLSPGEKLFGRARMLEKKTDYIQAYDIYLKAAKALRVEGNDADVYKCREALTRVGNIKMTYTHTAEAVRKIIKKAYPGTSDQRIDQVLKAGRLPHMKFAGKTYYFEDFLNTLYHLYPDFRTREEAGALGRMTKLFDVMEKYLYEKDTALPGQTRINPINYLAEGKVTLERNKFPAKGLLKVWLPLPLTTAAQQNVKIISLYPRKYIKYPLKLDGDIGIAYMEIPLEEIKKDLEIGMKFKLTHFEERFKVDPEKIGEYDKKSPLYKRYTASDQNIAVTPAIRKKAKELAGKETNPYKIAKIFFDHIVWDLDYSFTPHGALVALKIPESVFVQEHGYGDCGAQSMYFAALCRAVGIPARAPGGYQLFPLSKTGSGTHFWAQIYLPNYGWFPVDTSVGQLGKYMVGLSEKKQHDFVDYFYGNMDPFRYLIQQDVDIPFIPAPDGPLVFPMVLQTPTAVCAEMDENPGMSLMDNWKLVVKQVK